MLGLRGWNMVPRHGREGRAGEREEEHGKARRQESTVGHRMWREHEVLEGCRWP